MARRRSEGNMFLDSQESANISGNEKKTVENELPNEPAQGKPAASKAQKKPAKPAQKKEAAHLSDSLSVPSSVSDVLSILASTKETRQNGIAKSIYLDKDVHDRVLALSEQSGIPFSKIINMLLKAAFRDSES